MCFMEEGQEVGDSRLGVPCLSALAHGSQGKMGLKSQK